MTKCEVSWCMDPVCEPSGLCRVHVLDLPAGDPRLGPKVKFYSGSSRPGSLPRTSGKFFSLVTGKDGFDQLSEVPESFYAPEVPIEGPGAPDRAPQPQECM